MLIVFYQVIILAHCLLSQQLYWLLLQMSHFSGQIGQSKLVDIGYIIVNPISCIKSLYRLYYKPSVIAKS